MESLHDIAKRVELITFDCYGTLIDWNSGIRSALERVIDDCGASGRVDAEEVLAAYVAAEAGVQSQAWRPYRRVLAETLMRLAEQFQLTLLPQHRDLLAESLPEWRPFADTGPALVNLQKRFRLGVLSNIDRDLFARTARYFPIAFDLVVTAEDVRAYKPAHPHFLRALERLAAREKGVRSLPSERSSGSEAFPPQSGETTVGLRLLTPFSWLHVAQSAYHDGVPAGQLGIPWVWINRTASTNRYGATPLAEFRDLAALLAALQVGG